MILNAKIGGFMDFLGNFDLRDKSELRRNQLR